MRKETTKKYKRILATFCRIRGVDYDQCMEVFNTLTPEQKLINVTEVGRFNQAHEEEKRKEKNLQKKLKKGIIKKEETNTRRAIQKAQTPSVKIIS